MKRAKPRQRAVGVPDAARFVKPGEDSREREQFTFHVQLVDELYSEARTTYEDDFSDIAKLQDAARIIAEAAAAYE